MTDEKKWIEYFEGWVIGILSLILIVLTIASNQNEWICWLASTFCIYTIILKYPWSLFYDSNRP